MIEPMRDSTSYILERDEFKALVEGRFQIRHCKTCNGTGSVSYDTSGNVVGIGGVHDTSGDDPDTWIMSEDCECCHGVGCKVILN